MKTFFVRNAHWESFIHLLQLLVENSSALKNTKSWSSEVLLQFLLDDRKVKSQHFQWQELHHVAQSRPLVNSASLCIGISPSALWLPLDMLLEDAMDGSQVSATSAVEIITGDTFSFHASMLHLYYLIEIVSLTSTITGLVKSLQAINATSWHEVFLGLWMASLRLVQRV